MTTVLIIGIAIVIFNIGFYAGWRFSSNHDGAFLVALEDTGFLDPAWGKAENIMTIIDAMHARRQAEKGRK